MRPGEGSEGLTAVMIAVFLSGAAVSASRLALGQELPLPRKAPPQVRLIYSRGAGARSCPEFGKELQDEVSARLGYDPFSETASRVISARIERRGSGLTAQLEVTSPGSDGPREQRLESRSRNCHALIAAMSVAIGLAIAPLDPSMHAEARKLPPPPPLPEGETNASAEIEGSRPAVIRAAASPERQEVVAASSTGLTLHVSVGGDVATGRAQAVAGGVLVALEARWETFSLGAAAHLLLPTQKAVAGGVIQTSLVEGVADACFRRGVFGLCGLATADSQSAKGTGFKNASSASAALLDVGGRLLAEIPLFSSVDLWLFGDVLLPVIRASVRVSDTEEWRSPNVSFALGFALGAEIP